jgi:hypothetical protein
VGRANFYWLLRFGVDPGISETATRKDERMQLVFIHDRKVQIAISWNFLNGANKVPRRLYWPIGRAFRLDLQQSRQIFFG